MGIKKLYKVTKITPLSNPEWQIRCRWGLLGFSGFLATARDFVSSKKSNELHLRRKDKKKYGRIKNAQLATANINKNIEKKI